MSTKMSLEVKNMPQLDFRAALSTPEEKPFSPPASVAIAPIPARAAIPSYSFLRNLGLSRSTLANIVFVAIATMGGLVCAFYFFNGGELLRAAAAWPSEFLYPRPLSTDKIDVGVQANPVDQFSDSSKSTAASKKTIGESASPFEQNLWAPDLTQPTPTIDITSPVPPIVLPGSGIVIVPPPPPSSLLGDLNTLVTGADALVQSLYNTVNQTVTSVTPNTVTRTASSTISSTRRKISSTRQKLPVRSNVTSVRATTTSVSQTTQQMTSTQVQAPTIQNQTMFGGGMGGISGPGGVGTVGTVGTIGPVGVPGAVGTVGSLGGLGGLGSGLGGLGLGPH